LRCRFRRLPWYLGVAASLGCALGSQRFSTLLALLLPLSLKSRFACRPTCHDVAGVGSRFDAENTFTTEHFDGDAFLFSPLYDLRCPAHVVALPRAWNLRCFALAQEIDDSFPVDLIILILNV
jgi:hypothetical protein